MHPYVYDRWRQVRQAWPVLLIVFAGAILRFKGLNYQSLWLDELHTMNQADPSISWGALFRHLECCDQHPPLHFMLSKIVFGLFGHTDTVARMIPAVIGIAGVFSMYWLGRELRNKSTGLIAAVLTAVNYYHIYYSQEARMYVLSFLFASLSFLYFIRLIKNPAMKNVLGYTLLTLCFLYTHYYSLFALVAQATIGLIILFSEKPAPRKKMFQFFSLSGIIILAGYIPWMPYLANAMRLKSFWIAETDHRFLQNYFNEYFGNAEMLKPILVALLIVFVAGVAARSRRAGQLSLKHDQPAFALMLLSIWVFVTLLIPYIRSITAFPMLFPRYAIVVLPAFIIAIASGIDMFRQTILVWSISTLIVILSLINLFITHKHYSTLNKTQFREMTKFIVDNNASNYPIVNEVTMWHQSYYLKRFGSKADKLPGKKDAIIDSILRKTSLKYDLKGFWLAGAHGDKIPADSTFKALDTAYTIAKEVKLLDAWAYLFISKKSQEYISVSFRDFSGGNMLPEQNMVAIYNGSIHSAPVVLPKGKYELGITAYGDPGGGEYPHVNVYVNDRKIGDYNLTGSLSQMKFNFVNPADGKVIVKIELDNDFFEPGKGDRNVFVSRLVFEMAD